MSPRTSSTLEDVTHAVRSPYAFVLQSRCNDSNAEASDPYLRETHGTSR